MMDGQFVVKLLFDIKRTMEVIYTRTGANATISSFISDAFDFKNLVKNQLVLELENNVLIIRLL